MLKTLQYKIQKVHTQLKKYLFYIYPAIEVSFTLLENVMLNFQWNYRGVQAETPPPKTPRTS